MALKRISDSILYVGADDRTIDLFENQYPVSNGVTYNSYVIKDSKIAVMDTVDERATDQWFDNLEEAFEGKAPDYLVVSHLEPDHSGNIERFLKKYPDTIVVANAKTFAMLPQFIDIDVPEDKRFVAAEGTTLALGKHVLTFVMAPMVHWPEVMVEYESTEKVLFSADGFGTFGALGDRLKTSELENMPQSWADEARRYFINIVGKYGPSVQGLLKKASALDISVIAPLHGPVIDKDFDFYIDKYMRWSSYQPEEKGTVIAYSTLHGNTRKAALKLGDDLKKLSDEPVAVYDLSRDDCAKAVADSFRFDKLVLAGVTYDGGLMPCMEDFIYHLKMKNYQNRKAAVIENGSWGPVAGKLMTDALASFKNMNVCETKVTIKTRLNAKNESELSDLAKWLLN